MIDLFEAFSGIGAQCKALKNKDISHKVVATSEWDVNAICSYGAIHGINTEVASKVMKMSEDEVVDRIMSLTPSLDGKEPASREAIAKIKDKRKRLILSASMSHNNLGSIVDIDPDEVPDHDLFTYSFPCQDISLAGRQRGFDEDSDTRSSLLWECKKIIEAKKPKVLVLENVENLVKSKHIDNFNKWIDWLDSQGYRTKWKVVNSKDFLIPQSRSRVFAVSSLDRSVDFQFPTELELKTKLIDFLDDEVDDKYFASEKVSSRNQDNIKNALEEDKLEYDGQHRLFGLFDKDGKRRQAGAVWAKKGLCPTIDTMQGGYRQPCIIDDNRVRKITPVEAGRLMGFCDSDIEMSMKVNSNTQVYKQIGNSIVVTVLEAIFESINEQYFK